MDAELKAYLDLRFGQIDAHLERIDGRFEQVDARFEQVDARFEQVEARFEQVDARFESIEARFERKIDALADAMAAEIGSLHAEMRAGFVLVDEKLARIDDRLDRQGFMLAGGTKALGALLEHVVTLDSRYEIMRKEVTEMLGRVEQLERRAS